MRQENHGILVKQELQKIQSRKRKDAAAAARQKMQDKKDHSQRQKSLRQLLKQASNNFQQLAERSPEFKTFFSKLFRKHGNQLVLYSNSHNCDIQDTELELGITLEINNRYKVAISYNFFGNHEEDPKELLRDLTDLAHCDSGSRGWGLFLEISEILERLSKPELTVKFVFEKWNGGILLFKNCSLGI